VTLTDSEIAQLQRDLRDACEDRRAAAQASGDDAERQYWLIQRRIVESAISARELPRPEPAVETTIYTHHPTLLAAYPDAFQRSEVLVNIDYDLPGRQVPKLERAKESGGPVLVDYEALPRRDHAVDAYLGVVKPSFARIREEAPNARIALYQHCGRDDELHIAELEADRGDPEQAAFSASRRADMEATLTALDMASLDIDAITPVCYPPR